MTSPLDPLGLPEAAAPLVSFSSTLRGAGFAVAPEQTMGFVEAVGLLGPRGMSDIRRAAHALLAPPLERREEFDALFEAHFMGRAIAAPTLGDDDDPDDLLVQDARDGDAAPPEADDRRESGAEATAAETLAQRRFGDVDAARALLLFERAAPAALPRRRSYRRRSSRSGAALNMRRILRDAAKTDGEIVALPRLKRRTRLRRIVLLVDVSGSMKTQTDGAFRFAHAMARAAERVEVFAIGTRLTRVTRAIARRSRGQALAEVAGVVADWDGGTRIGDALQAFLAVPRYAGFARGAYVVVLSDGLERGDPAAMVDATRRLSQLAWSVDWLTPLAAAADFAPRTEALAAAAPHLSAIADGGSVESLCAHVLRKARSERL